MNLLQKEVNSFKAAICGVRDFFSNHRHARVHLLAGLLVMAAGVMFNISRCEWLSVLGCMALVFVAEAINTAIEYLTDLVSPAYHPLAGKIKDMAAGAVLLAALFAVIIGLCVFVPKIFFN